MSAEQLSQTITSAEQNVAPENIVAKKIMALADAVPEIAERADVIIPEAQRLAALHEVPAEVLEDPARALLFSAVANRSVARPDSDTEAFTTTAIELLKGESATNELADDESVRIYEEYEDVSLSSELQHAIDAGLLDDLKAKMGITKDNEEPYSVHVLDVGSDVSYLGLSPRLYDMDPEGDQAEEYRKFNESSEVYDRHKAEKATQIARGYELLQRTGQDQSNDLHAWMYKSKEGSRIYLTAPLAKKIMHPELTEDNRYYNENDYADDKAFLAHEYVHAQGGLNLDGNAGVAMGAEERRAEYFSGDEHGYPDVKAFWNDVLTVCNFDILKFFDSHEKGGSTEELLTQIAEKTDLDTMLNLALVAPLPYKQRDGRTAELYDLIGGYDGVIEKMLIDQMEQGNGAEIEKRIDQRAQAIAESVHAEFIISYRKKQGANVITDLVRDKMRYLRKKN